MFSAPGLVLLCLLSGVHLGAEPAGSVALRDDFSGPRLDESKWVRTRCNDFAAERVHLLNGMLRLAASTLGTDSRTVKWHGVRSRRRVVRVARGAVVAFELDWPDQINATYMSAGAYICPTASDNPHGEASWLRVVYVGVPPGQTARCLVSVRTAGQERMLLTEGWPRDRRGRAIDRQRIRITLSPDPRAGRSRLAVRVTVLENGATILEPTLVRLGFRKAYLYLQHSSHSNYPLREVLFDDVVVRTTTRKRPKN